MRTHALKSVLVAPSALCALVLIQKTWIAPPLILNSNKGGDICCTLQFDCFAEVTDKRLSNEASPLMMSLLCRIGAFNSLCDTIIRYMISFVCFFFLLKDLNSIIYSGQLILRNEFVKHPPPTALHYGLFASSHEMFFSWGPSAAVPRLFRHLHWPGSLPQYNGWNHLAAIRRTGSVNGASPLTTWDRRPIHV